MAVTLDQNLGSIGDDVNSTSIVLTTSQTAAANTLIVAFVYIWESTARTLTMSSSPSLGAWTASPVINTQGALDQVWITWVLAPSGLASGSTITATWDTSVTGARILGAASFLGIDQVSPFDTSAVNDQGATQNWSSGAATNARADALFVAVSGSEGTASQTNTATTGTELHDVAVSTAGQAMCSQYLIASSIASTALAGTWTGTNTSSTNALAIFNGVPPPQVLEAGRLIGEVI